MVPEPFMTPAKPGRGCGLRVAPTAASRESLRMCACAIVRLNDSIAKRALAEGHYKEALPAAAPWFPSGNRRAARLAEREGFEPPVRLPVRRISSAVLSTTQPPLRGAGRYQPALCNQGRSAKQGRGARSPSSISG